MAVAEFYGFWSYNQLVHGVYKLGGTKSCDLGGISAFGWDFGDDFSGEHWMGSYPDGIWEELMEPQNQTWELMEIFPVGVLSELMEIEDSRKKSLDWIGILFYI